MKQKELAKWLKLIVIIIALVGIIVFSKLIPDMAYSIGATDPEYGFLYYPVLIYVWISAIPFYYALFLVWKMCDDIQDNQSYSVNNIKRLKRISQLSLLEAIYYGLFPVFLGLFGAGHPGLLVIVVAIILICLAFSIVAAILSHLASKAHELEEENRLVV